MSVSKESDKNQASVGDFKTKPNMYEFRSESKKTFSQKAVKFGHVESANTGDPHEIILLDPVFVNPSSIENINLKLALRYIGKKANIMKFIIYKVMKYRKILMKYNVYFIFSLVKI